MKEALQSKLIEKLKSQGRDDRSVTMISDAFEMAYEKHINQKRRSGEPYIIHPTAVAEILSELKCDAQTICAGLLHDTLEDTETTEQELEDKFGKEVMLLVQGVTKLSKLNFNSSEDAQANNFRKMLLAIASDMRVVLVKLADRLHNMRTLHHLNEEKQKRIAKETLDIFAPLANRFGLGAIKSELEDLSFKYLDPAKYEKVNELVNAQHAERDERLKELIKIVSEVLEANGIDAKVTGRAKHFYSIQRKIEKQGNEEIYDLLGIRVKVNSVKECYEALGVIHENLRPMPGRFKDYIAMPKSNLYQSLHTTVLGPRGKTIEIQIRTKEMHDVAENGIAAHWNYKESGKSAKANEKEAEQLTWLRQLITWHTDLEDAKEYLDTVKADIFSQEVYILSPKGDVYTLPPESSPVDFAYRVHTKVGDTCTGAKVNGKIVPLSYKLQNGDLVEIITSKNSHPNIGWMEFVETNQAKHKIKAWYKQQNREQHIAIGKDLLEDEFGKDGIEQFIKSKEFKEASEKLNYTDVEDLLAAIGSGDNSVAQIKGRLEPSKQQDNSLEKLKARKAPTKGAEADIPDLDGLLYHIAKCCMPIPGEEVIGAVSKGRGISIHKIGCKNVKEIEAERLLEINWDAKENKSYPTSLNVEVYDRVGVVRDLLALIADANVNVRDFKVAGNPTNSTALLKIVVEVSGRNQILKLITAMDQMSDVLNVERV